jgi:lipopolysaccharide biosynthesis glycosyltransferase
MNAVALFCNHIMLPGLHVTISTLLKSLAPESRKHVTLHAFLDEVADKEKSLLRATHERFSNGVGLVIHDYSPRAPSGGNSLHGNTTTYGRLHLADLLPDHDRCVYLDVDLVVNRSIAELFEHFDESSVVIADGTGLRESSLDKKLFAEAGLDMSGKCFNAGVMGLNLALWRSRQISALCNEVSRKYAGKFLSADQALLNVALHDTFKPVGDDWNTPLYPSTPALSHPESRIYHFVGSPKPWDLFGAQLVANQSMWKREYESTEIGGGSPLRYASIKRSLRIVRQTAKALMDRRT